MNDVLPGTDCPAWECGHCGELTVKVEGFEMDDAQTTKLLPCPFCGGTDSLKVVESDNVFASPDNYFVVCDWLELGCGASGGTRRTKAGAIAAWNSRTIVEVEGMNQ